MTAYDDGRVSMADMRCIDGIPQELQELREKLGLSYAELGRMTNLPPSSVRRALDDGMGQLGIFCALAAALGRQLRIGERDPDIA